MQAEASAKAAPRLASLDVFRGATIASMILVNDPGTWDAVYPPLEHATWHGWTFTDLVFPFFLWIAGVSMTLSFARRTERGESRHRLLLHAARRAVIIFAIGLVLAGFPRYNLATLRIPGVLQRIAVCYLAAAAIFLYTRLRGQIAWTAGLLALYTVLMKFVPVPGYGAGVLEPNGNFAQYIDSLVLTGHMWSRTKTWDPEGLVSTLPAIATVLFGIFAGHLLRTAKTAAEKTAWMFVAGNLLLFAGVVLSPWMPINKNLWTVSYALFTAGMAFDVFALAYWVVDVLGRRRWAYPFTVFGMNALAIYVAAGGLARVLGLIQVGDASLQRWIFLHVFAPLAAPVNASLLYALAFVAVMYLAAWVLYLRRWFIKV